jgi:hypothetical protein
MKQFCFLALLALGSAWAQALKLQQLDRSPIHPVTFTLSRHTLTPSTVTLEKNAIYHICVRNGMYAEDVSFEIARKGRPVEAGDFIQIKRAKSANAYGYFRFTPGAYTLVVKQHPEYTVTIDVK